MILNHATFQARIAVIAVGLIVGEAQAWSTFKENFTLSCKPVGAGACISSKSDKSDATCFRDISISKRAKERTQLTYRRQPLLQEVRAPLKVIVDEDGEIQRELGKNTPGLSASWEGGEYWTKLLETPSGELVGSITFEEDFPVTVLCTE